METISELIIRLSCIVNDCNFLLELYVVMCSYLIFLFRYVFTIEDLDTVAPCYEHFKSGLEALKTKSSDKIEWDIKEIATDFPQYFTYERTKHLVLWKIEAIVK